MITDDAVADYFGERSTFNLEHSTAFTSEVSPSTMLRGGQASSVWVFPLDTIEGLPPRFPFSLTG
jgi:hypothetical protein